MISLVDKILATHRALDSESIPHAFGGALALAWCTGTARGTIDIDVNIFCRPDQAVEVFAALPPDVKWGAGDIESVESTGQVRLWWDSTPLDIFMNTTDYHQDVQQRCRVESFVGEDIPFLGCSDLAVFKAFFNRTKDWADIEAMIDAGTLDYERVIGVLTVYLGSDGERISRLLDLL